MKNNSFKQFLEEEKNIQDLMNNHGMILFFKKGQELFGAPEDSRLIFAKLKSGEDEPMMPGFKDEAKFMGINLFKLLFGSPEDSSENLFGSTDIPSIKVCDREEIVKKLMKHKKGKNVSVSKRR